MISAPSRSGLRAEVVEISGNRCEHPASNEQGKTIRCPFPMIEMAHITPRGMGHKGDRDVIENVMAACWDHARSTDDLSSNKWDDVPGWQLSNPGDVDFLMTKRQSLAHYVNNRRVNEGWAILF